MVKISSSKPSDEVPPDETSAKGRSTEKDAEDPESALVAEEGDTSEGGRHSKRRFFILISVVLLALAGIGVGLYFALGGSDDGGAYAVEAEWSVVNNCMYSYCYDRKFHKVSKKLSIGGSMSVTASDGVLETTLKSVEGEVASFEVSSNVRGCIRKSTTTARIGSGWGSWSGKGTCGQGGGHVVVTQARLQISS